MRNLFPNGIHVLFILFLFSFSPSIAQNTNFPKYPDANIVVLSDPHYYDASLGIDGEAFRQYLNKDRKLLKESRELLETAISKISNSKAEIVLIPGDLTKDGTLTSHTKFSGFMKELELLGKKVYVVPGNHDISNPQSYSFKDSLKVLVENISPSDFENIYSDHGYNEAIYRDSNSLSYIAEPIEGLWLFALDACRYDENVEGEHAVTAGKFKDETLVWINEMLDLSIREGKSTIGMMHHGILEHYNKQKKFFGEYVVDDYKDISKNFAGKGLKIVFTGHYHAQDIANRTFNNGDFIFDVETGSLVTYPCPIRQISIQNNQLEINSEYIAQIESHPDGFQAYSKEFVWSGIEGIATEALIGYKLKEEEARMLSGQIADAFIAHYQGDEISPKKPFSLKGVSCKGRFLISFKKKLIKNLWKDVTPEDNNLKIDLDNGEVL